MRTLQISGLVGAAWCLAGCSWSRFDDVTENAPVVLLKKPTDQNGFGVSLAAAAQPDHAKLFVGGSTRVSVGSTYELGGGDQPVRDAVDTGSCLVEGAGSCRLGASAVGLAEATIPGATDEFCFVFGTGETGPPAPRRGLLSRCESFVEYALDVPQAVLDGVVNRAILDPEGDYPVALSADQSASPSIVAGAKTVQRAWYYDAGGLDPVSLTPPGASVDPSFGTTVASVRLGAGGRVYAVGAPAEGHVWLFRSDAAGSDAQPVGCLGADAGFGRALTSGPVSVAASDDLVIAGAATVTIIAGSALGDLPVLPVGQAATCSFTGLPSGALVASMTCGTTPDLDGCAGSDFGRSVAVGDLDGDGDGEVLVGAPRMTVRGAERAGAVLVYDVEGPVLHRLLEAKFISSAEEGDQLGAALAAPMIGKRSIIAAGAPGNGKTALFYCSSLASSGARCK